MTGSATAHPSPAQRMPAKQKMALSLKSFASSLTSAITGSPKPTASDGESGPADVRSLFPKTDPAADGEECLRDCEGCSARYPRGFSIDEEDVLYGHVNAWDTHILVGTGKTDWVRDVEDEKGSVMEAIGKASEPVQGKLKLSASNIPNADDSTDYSQPTTALLLPSFTLVHNLLPSNTNLLITSIINKAPTTTSPLQPYAIPATISPPEGTTTTTIPALTTEQCPHSAVILMCSQRKRDARCGQSAPILQKELERHLRPLGLHRDLHDGRPGGVGIYFISHVGGHKYSANVMVYRRPNAFGQDDAVSAEANGHADEEEKKKEGEEKGEGSVGAAQCIWLARVKPEDCENLVRYTVLKGKVVKPETQLRGGFDRQKGLMSW